MIEILVHGAVSSAIYALLAVGFTLVFGVARVLNLAHGSFFAMGAYFTYLLATPLKLPLPLATVGAVALVSGIGWAVERWLIRPQRDSAIAVLMLTLALSLIVEQLLLAGFGSEVLNVPAYVDAKFSLGGVDIGGQRLLMLGVSVVVIAVLWSLINHTRAGAAILAISQDPLAAQYMGIPVDKVYGGVVALSAGLAALAGSLAGPFLSVQPGMGLPALTKAFAIVIVGGLGSLPGSLLAALLLGFAETSVSYLLSSSLTEAVSLAAVLLTLLLRPAGLLGKRAAF
jgi:branched-chain amino acid transport system permease protein